MKEMWLKLCLKYPRFTAFLTLIWNYTIGHPFTYDLLAGGVLWIAYETGWFKPWAFGAPLLFLLIRSYLRLRRMRQFTH